MNNWVSYRHDDVAFDEPDKYQLYVVFSRLNPAIVYEWVKTGMWSKSLFLKYYSSMRAFNTESL